MDVYAIVLLSGKEEDLVVCRHPLFSNGCLYEPFSDPGDRFTGGYLLYDF
jgi:hypothetical protein